MLLEDATTEDLPGVDVKSVERDPETEAVSLDPLRRLAPRVLTVSSTSTITRVRVLADVSLLTTLAVPIRDLKDPTASPRLLAETSPLLRPTSRDLLLVRPS